MLLLSKQSLINLFLGLIIVIFGGLMVAPMAHAEQSDISKQVCEGVPGGCDTTAAENRTNTLVNTVIDVLSFFIGVVAVIMIMYGGFRFINSAGDTAKITTARLIIIYALVGLVVVVLAQTIVKFVLDKFVV